MHDGFGSDFWEAKILEASLKNKPIDIIKSFFKIKLKSRKPLLFLISSHKMNDFLQNNDIVRSTSTKQEATLVGDNNSIKNKRKAMDQDFCDSLVNNIA